MSRSEVHAAVKRALAARLAAKAGAAIWPNVRNLAEFLDRGIRYVFVPERGELSRGMPTAHAAPPRLAHVAERDLPPVWPGAEGSVRGESLSSLYKSAPGAAKHDSRLSKLLGLVDAIRGARAREREKAKQELGKILGSYG